MLSITTSKSGPAPSGQPKTLSGAPSKNRSKRGFRSNMAAAARPPWSAMVLLVAAALVFGMTIKSEIWGSWLCPGSHLTGSQNGAGVVRAPLNVRAHSFRCAAHSNDHVLRGWPGLPPARLAGQGRVTSQRAPQTARRRRAEPARWSGRATRPRRRPSRLFGEVLARTRRAPRRRGGRTNRRTADPNANAVTGRQMEGDVAGLLAGAGEQLTSSGQPPRTSAQVNDTETAGPEFFWTPKNNAGRTPFTNVDQCPTPLADFPYKICACRINGPAAAIVKYLSITPGGELDLAACDYEGLLKFMTVTPDVATTKDAATVTVDTGYLKACRDTSPYPHPEAVYVRVPKGETLKDYGGIYVVHAATDKTVETYTPTGQLVVAHKIKDSFTGGRCNILVPAYVGVESGVYNVSDYAITHVGSPIAKAKIETLDRDDLLRGVFSFVQGLFRKPHEHALNPVAVQLPECLRSGAALLVAAEPYVDGRPVACYDFKRQLVCNGGGDWRVKVFTARLYTQLYGIALHLNVDVDEPSRALEKSALGRAQKVLASEQHDAYVNGLVRSLPPQGLEPAGQDLLRRLLSNQFNMSEAIGANSLHDMIYAKESPLAALAFCTAATLDAQMASYVDSLSTKLAYLAGEPGPIEVSPISTSYVPLRIDVSQITIDHAYYQASRFGAAPTCKEWWTQCRITSSASTPSTRRSISREPDSLVVFHTGGSASIIR